ncbi:MAG: bifunctional diaminohydroxyphosphoribosylaminopyrimidine deaminase/5-amino-6-(5-phosphoribosylamino)uracil reductase RibD [Porcipelethomonas sp.]
MTKEEYMKIALDEAVKGMGFTSPNPMVGAVIVRDGRIISRDYHHRCGEFHAERNAINNCKEDMHGAEIYVTLEPCCHYGKTPPCTEAIIQSGIKKVYYGSDDPNPLVAGKGAEILRNHGIEVESGILKAECDAVNDVFFHYITHKTPFVVMKYAMTADGKIACYNGESKWITGEEARQNVQKSRLRYSAIMVGVGTVLADDPQLTCRLENGRNPVRIICDSRLRTPLDSNIVKTALEVPTIIACLETVENGEEYEKKGVKLLRVGEKDGHIDLAELMKKLGELKIDSILLEGGAQLNYSALQAGIVNKVQAYISPKIFGGKTAPSPVGSEGVSSPAEGFMLKNPRISSFGEDFLIEWEVKR